MGKRTVWKVAFGTWLSICEGTNAINPIHYSAIFKFVRQKCFCRFFQGSLLLLLVLSHYSKMQVQILHYPPRLANAICRSSFIIIFNYKD